MCVCSTSQSRWVDIPDVIIRTVIATNLLSSGDALREIYNLQVIKSDFILVSGDVISNMKLQPVLEAHRYPNAKRALCRGVCGVSGRLPC